MNSSTENVVNQMLEPIFRTLPEDAARRIAEFEAAPEMQERVAELARKANEGELTEQEQQDYMSLIAAGDIIDTLSALARHALRRTA